MKNRDVAKLTDKYVAQTYARYPIALVRGKGARVWDADGKEYLDFLAGIAVNSLGHCHPAVVRAIQQQSRKLIHVSNLYHILPQSELARELCRHSFADRVFFVTAARKPTKPPSNWRGATARRISAANTRSSPLTIPFTDVRSRR